MRRRSNSVQNSCATFSHGILTARRLPSCRVRRPLFSGGHSMPTVKELNVNGGKRAVDADAERTLLSVLRDDLDLTGCKYGCGEGRCGACTVLVDGQPIRSCLAAVGAAAGKAITTIEDLAGKDGKLHPVQEAFLET